jgi:hypothetical protein
LAVELILVAVVCLTLVFVVLVGVVFTSGHTLDQDSDTHVIPMPFNREPGNGDR